MESIITAGDTRIIENKWFPIFRKKKQLLGSQRLLKDLLGGQVSERLSVARRIPQFGVTNGQNSLKITKT